MPPPISREEARAFKTRWEFVGEVERTELRKASPEEKFRQLAALMSPSEEWIGKRRSDDRESKVRNRWNRLRTILGD
jgi:hypothetical protein